MRLRAAATMAAVVTASGFLLAGNASAVSSGNVLYVDNSATSQCSDTTTDSSVAPYCTIQAAANAAVAGDTVQVKSGDTFGGGTSIGTSGTAAAPITIEGKGVGIAATSAADGFDVTGAQYVHLSGFTVHGSGTGILVKDSAHVVLSGLTVQSSGINALSNGVDLQNSADSEVSTSSFAGPFGSSAITMYGGTGDTATTNVVSGDRANGILAIGAPDSAITSNTLIGLCDGVGIGVEGGASGLSTGSTIENNVLADFACSTIAIEGDSQEVARADYNVVYPGGGNQATYYWLPTAASNTSASYTTPAQFCSATGQGCEDLTTNPEIATGGTNPGAIVGSNSPLIDSADSAAPGELATDFSGERRFDDPFVPDTGVGTSTSYDRGADEYQDPLAANGSLTALSTPVDAFGVEILTAAPPDAFGTITYSYDFGDGSAVSTSATHHYATLGTHTVTVTATDTAGTTQTTTVKATTAGSEYTPYGPKRLLDTRAGLGAPAGAVPSGSHVTLQIEGNSSLPATGITAVALNVTAVDTTGNGFVDVHPDLQGTTTSLLNYRAGQTIANSVIVPIGVDGKIDIDDNGVNSSVKADLIADVTGYFTGAAASGYTSVDPSRLLDTRNGIGGTHGAVAGGHKVTLDIAGTDGGVLPASGITAVSLNLTAVDATGGGFLTAYPDGQPVPTASNLNYAEGQTVAVAAIVPVGKDGSIDIYVGGRATQSVDVIADVNGYYSASGADAYVALDPQRLIDTRSTGGALAANGTVTFQPGGAPQFDVQMPTGELESFVLPVDASAFDFNLTATQGVTHGLIMTYPAGQVSSKPNVSTLNYGPGQTVANFAQATSGGAADNGAVVFANASAGGSVQLIADLFGLYSAN